MIALQFAPVQSTGAFRSIEFAKRLPQYGVRPTVLTIDPQQASKIFGGQIAPDLFDGIPEAVEIHYLRERSVVASEKPVARWWRMLTTLDDSFERRFTCSLGDTLTTLQRQPRCFSAVYVSAPPFGATMLGVTAAKALGVPYILDMRDAWAEWSPSPQVTRLHYARKHYDEARAFATASAIVGVTPELTELFANSHPELPRSRFHTITNGVDIGAGLPDSAVWEGTADTINIGYMGSFYWTPAKPASLWAPHRFLQYDPKTEDWSYRSPLYFFRAWAKLDQVSPEIGRRVRFHHAGKTPDWLMPMAAEFGLADRCHFHGQLHKQQVTGFLDQMTGLLATSMKRNSGIDYCIASKSFEYLRSGKPTLAFVCEGAQKRFFEEVGGAIVFDPDDAMRCAEQLRSLFTQTHILPIRREELQVYELAHTASQMATLIKQITPGEANRAIPDAT